MLTLLLTSLPNSLAMFIKNSDYEMSDQSVS
ncbi:Uncharacterised protein [Yersinia pseudotuberculosis]|nr:hypothetical protein BZ23_2932 [Yersinia pseudotuberculosis]CNL04079.1 Uncharacterised protein [Yersinia pseudotuberculosis]SQA57563.1 Uncharacterised protein [Yersinia pseudotuberculosis]SUB31785.1 Uncharacterised protein [Yersinia pseudotuberculosis]SUQ37703.1 Uncharacterised protein [Yersinia pseudotuberculosis]